MLALFADHTFAVAGGELSCQGGEGQIPDEVGTVVAEKKGRSRLVTSNVSDLETALGACEDTDVNVVRTAGWFKPTRHGGLRGKRTDHVRFPQTRLDTITVFTFGAEPTDGSASPTASGAESCARIDQCLPARALTCHISGERH